MNPGQGPFVRKRTAASVRAGRTRWRERGFTACEQLENRRMLTVDSEPLLPLQASELSASATQDVMPMSALSMLSEGVTPQASSSPGGYSPTQIRHAYGFDQITFDAGMVVGDGSGQTIAVVNAYHTPTALNDLTQFSNYFGLPAPNLLQVDLSTTHSAVSNWVTETLLDIEWVHALAPGATILLVEAADATWSSLGAAIDYARQQPGVSAVSMSWGGAEDASTPSFDTHFATPDEHANVAFFAAAGNSGAPGLYPALSNDVMAVGGTSLSLDTNGNYLSESSWSSGGGSVSIYQSQPSWQNGVVTQSSTNRAMPDVAFDANPSTGVSIYDTYNNSVGAPWTNLGGTSFATPSWASLVAIADQGRDLAGLPTLDIPELMTAIYAMPASNFHDITSSGGAPANNAGPGFDLVTGRGTPKALSVVEYLVGTSSVAGTVFDDANGNGVLDGESGLSGWRVFADLDSDGLFDSQVVTNRSNNTGFNISNTALSTINVSGLAANIIDVNVSVDITHTRPSDLVITLIAPDGTEITLANHDGDSNDNFAGTTFDDSAPKSISVGFGPFTGSYHPVDKLLDLFAKSPNGNWQLRVEDTVLGAGGTLDSWSLQLTTGDPSTLSAGDGTYFIEGLPSGTYPIREVLQAPYTQTSPAGGSYTVNLGYAANVTARNFGNQLPTSQVVGRHVFYNQSKFDGNSAANDVNDDNAIPSNKTAYLPGEGQMILANITNYMRGLNGIMVDLAGAGSHTSINASDFVFKVGTDNSPDNWTVLTATPTISVRTGAGISGSDRVDITWNNNVIQDEYLEVQVLATAHTGLSAALGTIGGNAVGDVFFFGNLRGETASATPRGAFVRTVSADGNPIVAAGSVANVGIDSFLDIDRNNAITYSSDRNPIVASGLGSLTRISIGAAGPFAPEGGGGTVQPLAASTAGASSESGESSIAVEPTTAMALTDQSLGSAPLPAAATSPASMVLGAPISAVRATSPAIQAMVLPSVTSRSHGGDQGFGSGESTIQHGKLKKLSVGGLARAAVEGSLQLLATADASTWLRIDVDDGSDALDLVDDDLLDLLATGRGRVGLRGR